MNIRVCDIAAAVGAECTYDAVVSSVITDSRSLFEPDKTLFVALRTRGNDGHRYMGAMYRAGVRFFLAEHLTDDVGDDACVLVVDDSEVALQQLGRMVRGRIGCPMLGVTGSAGKTIVKEWLFLMLAPSVFVTRSPRSYNSQIGVPLGLCSLETDAELAIVEAGISRSGEMQTLRDMILPDRVLLTSLTDEHSEGFVTRQEKAREKMSLAADASVVIYSADEPEYEAAAAALQPGVSRFTWTLNEAQGASLAIDVKTDEQATLLHWRYAPGVSGEARMNFSATDIDVANAAAALAYLIASGYDAEFIREAFTRIYPIGTRLDVSEGVNGCSIIYDKFTADYSSLPTALDFQRRRSTSGLSNTLIVSDMYRGSASWAQVMQKLSELCRLAGVSRMICVGVGLSSVARHTARDIKTEFYAGREDFESQVGPSDFSSELILIKGAPGFRFLEMAENLEARKHGTVLEVDLDAAVRNFNYFRQRLPQGTGIVAMVKAAGYGAGSIELSRTLQSQGAAYLAVAVVDEGIELRQAGITMPIMVMNPRSVNYKAIFAYGLEPEIYSLDMLADVIAEAEKSGLNHYPVHIKLDTGMHRMGFTEDEIGQLCRMLQTTEAIRVLSVFSHLATADCPDMDEYTDGQLERFARMTQSIVELLGYDFKRHVLNTAGILRRPEHHYDMVRLGIGLYGVTPFDAGEQLATVSTLRTVISNIREWPAGEAIGYGRRGVLDQPSRIATLPIGYADGMNRRLGNGVGRVYINGSYAPVVGNICMDACMVDVTGIDCRIGDTVEVFGPHVRVEEIAEAIGTIPYEVLTSVSPRVKKVYYRE